MEGEVADEDETPALLHFHAFEDMTQDDRVRLKETNAARVRFAKDAYRVILETVWSNVGLIEEYERCAMDALSFCDRFNRRGELRHLGEAFRDHSRKLHDDEIRLKAMTKEQASKKEYESKITNESVFQSRLRIYLRHIDSCLKLNNWQECLSVVDDIMDLLFFARIMTNVQLDTRMIILDALRSIYEKGNQPFLLCIVLSNLFNFHPSDEIAQDWALTVCTLAPASRNAVLEMSESASFSADVMDSVHARLSQFLGIPSIPSTENLVASFFHSGAISLLSEDLKDFFYALHADTSNTRSRKEGFSPFQLIKLVRRLRENLGDDMIFKFRPMILTRFVDQLSCVFDVVAFDTLKKIGEVLDLDFPSVERYVVSYFHSSGVRVDHGHQCLVLNGKPLAVKEFRSGISRVFSRLRRMYPAPMEAMDRITVDATADEEDRLRAVRRVKDAHEYTEKEQKAFEASVIQRREKEERELKEREKEKMEEIQKVKQRAKKEESDDNDFKEFIKLATGIIQAFEDRQNISTDLGTQLRENQEEIYRKGEEFFDEVLDRFVEEYDTKQEKFESDVRKLRFVSYATRQEEQELVPVLFEKKRDEIERTYKQRLALVEMEREDLSRRRQELAALFEEMRSEKKVFVDSFLMKARHDRFEREQKEQEQRRLDRNRRLEKERENRKKMEQITLKLDEEAKVEREKKWEEQRRQQDARIGAFMRRTAETEESKAESTSDWRSVRVSARPPRSTSDASVERSHSDRPWARGTPRVEDRSASQTVADDAADWRAGRIARKPVEAVEGFGRDRRPDAKPQESSEGAGVWKPSPSPKRAWGGKELRDDESSATGAAWRSKKPIASQDTDESTGKYVRDDRHGGGVDHSAKDEEDSWRTVGGDRSKEEPKAIVGDDVRDEETSSFHRGDRFSRRGDFSSTRDDAPRRVDDSVPKDDTPRTTDGEERGLSHSRVYGSGGDSGGGWGERRQYRGTRGGRGGRFEGRKSDRGGRDESAVERAPEAGSWRRS
eukprot:TRINITY_DN139_c0_g1_i3.p1 TRINITY_DN139_c0_g1~~TRINITY_DN139_c0_g1_i3.p1  ORF type:complete len:1145 (-),score=379.04 TRINITY_DN139_c0_g1_i3:21-3047(-)